MAENRKISITRNLGIEAASAEAIASQLPGRENGLADAYRHIIWVAEMARRLPETVTSRIAGFHEILGSLSGSQSIDAEDMDRHNNEIGMAVGKMVAKKGGNFRDVVIAAQQIIERSIEDDAGAFIKLPDGTRVKKATWLPPNKWGKNPKVPVTDATGKVTGERELTNSESNWPGPGWTKHFVPESYDYPHGGPVKSDGEKLSPKKTGIIPDEKSDGRSATWTDDEAVPGDATDAERVDTRRPDKTPSSEARRLLGQLRGAKDTASEIIAKPPSSVTEDEVDRVVASDAYWNRHDPLHQESDDFVRLATAHVWGTGPITRDVTGRTVDGVPINPFPVKPTPTRAADGGTVSDGAVRVAEELARLEKDGGLAGPVGALQSVLNGIPGAGGGKPLKKDGAFGPKTETRLRQSVALAGAGPVIDALRKQLELQPVR